MAGRFRLYLYQVTPNYTYHALEFSFLCRLFQHVRSFSGDEDSSWTPSSRQKGVYICIWRQGYLNEYIERLPDMPEL